MIILSQKLMKILSSSRKIQYKTPPYHSLSLSSKRYKFRVFTLYKINKQTGWKQYLWNRLMYKIATV